MQGTQYIPQVVPTSRPVVFWAISASVVALLVLLVVIAPLAAAAGHDQIARGLYGAFGTLCHQLSDRSYFIDEHQLAVCSRCTGLYGGFALTLLVYPLLRSLRTTGAPARSWLLLAALPTLIDFSLTFFGIWENTHTSRVLTGFLLGSAVVFYVMPGVVELSFRAFRARTSGPVEETFTLASPERIAAAPSDYRRKNVPRIQ